jgi:hypothetical protein
MLAYPRRGRYQGGKADITQQTRLISTRATFLSAEVAESAHLLFPPSEIHLRNAGVAARMKKPDPPEFRARENAK